MGIIKNINFLGLKLSVFSNAELIYEIERTILDGETKICYGYNFGMFPYFKKYPEIPQYGNQFDISVADGRGYFLLAKMLGFKVKSDISIPYMVDMVLELAERKRFSVMLLGAKSEINELASAKLKIKYPNVIVLRGRDGYFNEFEEDVIINGINLIKPDILLIGISSPIKERIAYKCKKKLNARIIVPCGGVIDILAGYKKRIPRWVKKSGFAWFYRFVQEPKRLFRDSIINSASVVFILIPRILFEFYLKRNKDFSIPSYYSKSVKAPISDLT